MQIERYNNVTKKSTSMNAFLLDFLAFGAVLSGIMVITTKNPVVSVLFLIAVFVNSAGYLLLLGVGFIGISYLIVYVGAIAILFLFVIMMLNIQLTEILSVGLEYTQNLPLGLMVGSLFFLEVLSVIPFRTIDRNAFTLGLFNSLNGLLLDIDVSSIGSTVHLANALPRADQNFTNFLQIESIGQGLYTYGSLWLLLTSIILLLAIIGPIALCLRSTQNQRNHAN